MRVALVVAISENGVIGRDGGLPWRISSDLKYFRRLTMNKPVVMGRRTYESLPRTLDGRTMIVLSRTIEAAPDALLARSVEEALALAQADCVARDADEIAVIGGAEVFSALLPYTGHAYLTRVHADVAGDTHFALARGEWVERGRHYFAAGARDDHSFSTMTLIRAAAPQPLPALQPAMPAAI